MIPLILCSSIEMLSFDQISELESETTTQQQATIHTPALPPNSSNHTAIIGYAFCSTLPDFTGAIGCDNYPCHGVTLIVSAYLNCCQVAAVSSSQTYQNCTALNKLSYGFTKWPSGHHPILGSSWEWHFAHYGRFPQQSQEPTTRIPRIGTGLSRNLQDCQRIESKSSRAFSIEPTIPRKGYPRTHESFDKDIRRLHASPEIAAEIHGL